MDEDEKHKKINQSHVEMAARNTRNQKNVSFGGSPSMKKGMVLPFQPLSVAFNHINYYVDMPTVSQSNIQII